MFERALVLVVKFKKKMIYNIIKRAVFIGLIITGIAFFFMNAFIVFWVISVFYLLGPRLENIMDRVICGQELACHKVKRTDIVALILLAVELFCDIGLYIEAHSG